MGLSWEVAELGQTWSGDTSFLIETKVLVLCQIFRNVDPATSSAVCNEVSTITSFQRNAYRTVND